MSGSALSTIDGGGSYLTQWREPEEVLAEAQKAATALKRVVGMKKNPVMFNGEQYLEREDWGTVAKFYGCTAKTVETHYVEFGSERGFEAVAVVIDRNMNEIGRAESMCLTGEEQWGEVAKYEWQDEIDPKTGKKIWDDNKKRYKSKKVQVGMVAKPLFQLRSMASTRAEAKALKGVFSWVVVLAGYQPTPAEEMTGNERELHQDHEPEKKPAPEVQRKSQKTTGGFPPAAAKVEKVICSECRAEDGKHTAECSKSIPADAGDAYEGPDPGQSEAKVEAKAEQTTGTAEEKWAATEGHDPKKHISFKQGKLLFVIQSKVGISEESMKKYMLDHLKIEHRPLIEKKDFEPLLAAMDPNHDHHEEKK